MKRGPVEARPRGSKVALLRRATSLFRPYRGRFLLLVLLLGTTTTLDLVAVRLLGSMVDEMTSGAGGALNTLFLIFVTIVMASAFLGVGQAYVNQEIGQGIMQRLRSGLHRHLQRLPVSFFTRTRTGEILSRVSTDVNAVQQAVTGTFTELLASLLALVIAFVLMVQLNWQMALITFALLPLWVYPTVRVGRHMRALTRQWHVESAAMTSQLEETLSVSGSMLVKAFGREDFESERFEATNGRMRSLAVSRLMAGRWFNMGTTLFGALIPGLVYWYGGRAVLGASSLSAGDVVAFAMITQRVFGPFATLARLNTTLLSSAALFERIFEYLDLPLEVDERPGAATLEPVRGEVEFDDVRFAYGADDRPALDGISFRAGSGTMVALVGPSGAGKSTVTHLLQRFYDPQAGSVRIDGQDLRDLTLASVSGAVGAVMQETYLFHASLRQNIRYGRLEATDDEVRAAADSAGLSGLLDHLPEGLDTVVGERGFRLSGGERQRVAIARAILKNPRILVLDEATSSLDSRLESEIQAAMERLAEGRTTIVIAHRLSTVVRADLILVMDGGRIVERGRHGELMARNGLYASLHREQTRQPVDYREGTSDMSTETPSEPKIERRPPPVMAVVTRVEEVTPRIRRVVLGPMTGSTPPVVFEPGSGRNVKLHFPREGQSEPELPVIGPEGLLEPSADTRALSRSYTVRRDDQRTGEVSIDFVLHEEDGPASRWARQASVGSLIGIAGPRGSAIPEADWYLLMGDETGLPNIAHFLETTDKGTRGQAFIEVADAGEEQPLNTHMAVTWLHRDGTPSSESSLVREALGRVDWPQDASIVVWAAGESGVIRDLRDALRQVPACENATVIAKGYWTYGVAKGSRPKALPATDVAVSG